MKIIFIILIVFLILPLSVFAIDWPEFSISAGGGGLIGYTFTRYTLKGGDVTSTQEMDRFNIGGFIFADFTYAEFSVSYQFGRNNYSEKMYLGDLSIITSGVGQEMSLGFSLLGKYPFKINDKFKLFPLLGVEYQVALQQLRKPKDGEYAGFVVDRTSGRLMEDMDKDGDPYPLSAWNSWNIILGVGTDFYLTEQLFLRGEFLFGFRLPTGYEMGALKLVEKGFGVSNAKLGGINGSPTLKIAVGYKFKLPEKREKRVESREQGTESSEQTTTEQVVGSREQVEESSEQRAESSEELEEVEVEIEEVVELELEVDEIIEEFKEIEEIEEIEVEINEESEEIVEEETIEEFEEIEEEERFYGYSVENFY